jgi:hypothetical protein
MCPATLPLKDPMGPSFRWGNLERAGISASRDRSRIERPPASILFGRLRLELDIVLDAHALDHVELLF